MKLKKLSKKITNNILPYSKQYLDREDFKSVIKVLKSDYLTQGNQVGKFEKLLNKEVGSNYAVAVNSATSALHIACLAIGLKKGDVLWTVPNTFVASANCGLYCGASIDFVDINYNNFNIDVSLLEEKLKKTNKKKLPKILVVVHLAGQPAFMEKIFNLKKKYRFKIIEDASHALGASRNNLKVGSCKYSDICVFSFHPVKPITSAEGGAALTNDKLYYEKMNMLRTHGVTKNKKLFFNKKNHGDWYYEQQLLGFNYRMSDVHAALGISQLKKLNKFIKERNKLALNYSKLLQDLPILLPKIEKGNISSYHLYIIRFPNVNLNTYKKIFNFLRKNRIFVNLHYMPIYSHPFYKKNFKFKKFPMSMKYSKSAMSIPIFFGLKLKEQLYIKRKIFEVTKKYIKNV